MFYNERNGKIRNLWQFLKNTTEDRIIVRTTYVTLGWDDVQSEARSAGFNVCRFNSPVLAARHEFSECYKFTRFH